MAAGLQKPRGFGGSLLVDRNRLELMETQSLQTLRLNIVEESW